MSTSAVRVLIVGPATPSTNGILKKLARAGWGSHAVGGVHEAETVLKTIRFKVVLSSEKLPDGTGYELAALIARQGGSLFIGVTLSETCLWLPVIERGERSLGKRAINPTALEAEIAELLRVLKATEPAAPKDFRPTGLPQDHSNDVRQTAVLYFERGGVDFLTHLNGNVSSERVVDGLQGGTRKTAIPPRRKFGESGSGMKRLESVPGGGGKASTGTHGKTWRG
jgi:hypothetical protein